MRVVYIAAGIFFVALGIIGAVLPVMPSTVFFIIAAYFFAKSSDYLYNKLLELPYVGKHIRIWEKKKAIPKRARTTAITFTIFGTFTGIFLSVLSFNIWALVGVIIFGVSMLAILLKIRTY